jgi:4-alpha-glucanotransferase
MLYDAPSELLVFPIQDVFGWNDRINVPATVSDENWTWRLPWPVDALDQEPQAQERARVLRGLAEGSGRRGA